MKAHHDDLLGGHCGYLKTLNKILQWYWWPKIRKRCEGMGTNMCSLSNPF